MLESVLKKIDMSRDESLVGLDKFLRIPSVSAQPDRSADVRRCAEFVKYQLELAGMTAELWETPGHPVVYGATTIDAGKPTVLFYGHYDVQPPEPLDEWTTPAFEPTVRDGAIYARGASDDKGQVWAHLRALQAWHQIAERPPVNVIALIEGEEEVSSVNLEAAIEANKAKLKADVALVSDTTQFAPGQPAITYGLRGLTYIEVFLKAANRDLHSGVYGGSVPNPANVLGALIASLHNADGRVNIPGFYDKVDAVTDKERQQFGALGYDEAGDAAGLGLPFFSGESGFSTLERRWIRPTCDVHGITTGYQGAGAKTVIPSVASAKISCRLTPSQDPAVIEAALTQALKDRCPKNVQIDVVSHGGGEAIALDPESAWVGLAGDAIEAGFGKRPVLIREGGSIPIVASMQKSLDLQTLLVGFGMYDDAVHAPNEKFDLDSLHKGERTAAALYERLASG